MLKLRFLALPILFSFLVCRAFGADETQGDPLYEGWLKMYDLRFEEAHQPISLWQKSHPADPLGPASHAAGYLFAELARLGVLESELFINDNRFKGRRQLQTDPESKQLFLKQIAAADRLADAALQNQPNNEHALFAKSLSLGLLADYSALIEKHNLVALHYTKDSRTYSEKLLGVNTDAYDAYLGPGVEKYLLSLKAAPVPSEPSLRT
jgi:hypothetical protein